MQVVKLNKTFTVTADAGSQLDLDAHTDLVMEALMDLENETVFDSDVSVNISTNTVWISIAASGDTFEEASACADACIRTAIHAAGGHTPSWGQVQFTTSKSEADLVAA